MMTSESNQTNPPAVWPDFLLFSGDSAIVSGRRLYRALGNPNDRYFTDWFNLRIEKLQLAIDRHYTARRLGGKRLDYLLTFQTALTIVAAEKGKRKGTNHQMLLNLRVQLKREGLSTAASARLNEVILNSVENKPSPRKVGSSPEIGLFQPEPPRVQPSPDREPVAPPEPLFFDHQPTGEGYDEPADHHEPQYENIPDGVLTPAEIIHQQSRLLLEHERQIRELQAQMGQVVSIQKQSALQFMGMATESKAPPTQTLRSKIREQVNAYCRSTGQSQEWTYNQIYNRLFYLYNIKVKSYQRHSSETYLETAERAGFLDKVFAIVSREFKPVSSDQSSAFSNQASH